MLLMTVGVGLLLVTAACTGGSTAPTQDSDALALASMSDQAAQLAREVLPDAVLRQVNVTSDGTFTFRFTDPEASQTTLMVKVPSPDVPTEQWQILDVGQTPLMGHPEPGLRVESLLVGPEAAQRAATSHWQDCRISDLGLGGSEENLVWYVSCQVAQGGVSGIVDGRTGDFTPSPAPPAVPAPTAMPSVPSVDNTPTPTPTDPQADEYAAREQYMRNAIAGMPDEQKIWVDQDTVVYLATTASGRWTAMAHHMPTSAVISYDDQGVEIARNTSRHPDAPKFADEMSKNPGVKAAVQELFDRVTASGSSPIPTSTPIQEDSPTIACSPQTKELPCGSGVEIGSSYPYQLYTHCGIRWAYFDGHWWKASPALDDGSGNPPSGWGNPFDNGSMVLISDNLAQFTSDAGQTANFEPLPRDIQEYPGEICF